MIVILHADDDRQYWLGNVIRHGKELEAVLRRKVVVLPRDSIARARAVVSGMDEEMSKLLDQGHKLDAVILDLLMGGGSEENVRTWLEGVKGLAERLFPPGQPEAAPSEAAGRLPEDALEEIDQKCPAFAVGRSAAERGATVVVLSNVAKALKPERLDAETEHKLIMAACGASAYVAKVDDLWLEKLQEALGALCADERP